MQVDPIKTPFFVNVYATSLGETYCGPPWGERKDAERSAVKEGLNSRVRVTVLRGYPKAEG